MLVGDFIDRIEIVAGIQPNESQKPPVFAEEITDVSTITYESSVLPYFTNKTLCYSGEEYHEKDNICTLPVTCKSNLECSVWGDQVLTELEQKYDGFKEFYGFLDDDSYAYYESDHNLEEDVHWIDVWLGDDATSVTGYDEKIVAYYELDGLDLNYSEANRDEYNADWYFDEFKWIIPSEQIWMLDSFSLFEDEELIAYVVQEKADLSSWNLALNVNTNIRYQDSISTHVHEFAHLLFLNSTQVRGNPPPLSCLNSIYVEEKGCVYETSYMFDFVEQFGLDYEVEFNEQFFVSNYASSDVLEDMAESFYMFVLSEKPNDDSIAAQKVLFFYNYDELVLLRAQILSRVATYLYRVL